MRAGVTPDGVIASVFRLWLLLLREQIAMPHAARVEAAYAFAPLPEGILVRASAQALDDGRGYAARPHADGDIVQPHGRQVLEVMLDFRWLIFVHHTNLIRRRSISQYNATYTYYLLYARVLQKPIRRRKLDSYGQNEKQPSRADDGCRGNRL